MDRGVLLFNLGGPETLDDVRPFLYNLFSDPEIIRIKNETLRRLLAWFIATVRQGKSRGLYRQIGGGSPLRMITEAQATALSAALETRGFQAKVYVGMRCWKPSIDDAVASILNDHITDLVLLPLFPQYSVTTTGSCLKYFEALARQTGLPSRVKTTVIDSWFNEPSYLDSIVELIRQEAQNFSLRETRPIHLLYSAHSIPARYVDEGDPYLEQTRQTVALINGRLGDTYPCTLAFQSKVGPVRWLGPSTAAVLEELGKGGKTAVLTVPISFVSDHIETLQEIDIAYRHIAEKAGIVEFRRIPALNTAPMFIEGLAGLVADHW
jgi:ferrochelatase